MISPYAYAGMKNRPVFNKWTIREIFDKVCIAEKVDQFEAKERNRSQGKVKVRQITCYLARRKTKMTLKQIAGFFGFDHTSIMHSIQQVNNHISTGLWSEEYIISILN